MMQQELPGLQILATSTCPHSVLSQDCSRCQMEAFNNCETPLLKDIRQSIIKPLVHGPHQTYLLDFRYAADREVVFNDTHSYETVEYDGLLPATTPVKPLLEELEAEEDEGDRPSQLPEDLKRLRLVFIGSLEAYLGFLMCLLSKYGSATMIPFGLDVGGSAHIQQLLLERWFCGEDLDSCMFQRDPTGTAYIHRDGPGGGDLLSTRNLEEFICGYKKMREMVIAGVMARKDGPLTIHFKQLNRAVGTDPEDVAFDDYPVRTSCKAYWYFM